MDIVDTILDAGVIGAGGAGFPTHIKLKTRVKTYIANGSECEPLLYKDRYLMENHSDEVLSGLLTAMKATGALKGYIAIKEKNKKAITSLKNLLKGTNRIEIVTLPDTYPMGDEFLLTEHITGKRVPQLGIPPDIGVMVNNIETLYNIHNAIEEKEGVTDKYISVIGNVKRPGLYKVPLGIFYGEILKKAEPNDKDFSLIADGLMMGRLVDMDNPVTKTTSALFILAPNKTVPINYSLTLEQIQTRARSACEHCHQCTDMCPRYLLGYDIEPHRIIRTFSFSITNNPDDYRGVTNCCECGVCESYACPMGLSPRRICSYLKTLTNEYKSNEIKDIHQERDNRQIPVSRLTMRLGMDYYKINDINYYELETDEVRLPLNQNFGTPSKPIVKNGDEVERGEVIAVPQGEISSTIHSSISGFVQVVNDIIIVRR